MSKLDNQTLFDTVARHLLRQKKRSGKYVPMGDGSSKFQCMYRAPDGCKCAAGAILPDDRYYPDMEGQNLHGDRELWESLVDNSFLLKLLQAAHDGELGTFDGSTQPQESTADPDAMDWTPVWQLRLRYVATSFHLNPSVLDEPVEV